MSSFNETPAVEFQRFELTVYSDGSVHRAPFDPPPVPACPSPSQPHLHVASKDLSLNPILGTSLRLFLPSLSSPSQKLPILLYFHGGAFLHFCTAVLPIHRYLCRLAAHVGALIVSVDYRLAPEHPLPAAYEDGYEGLLWLNQQASLGASGEPWLANHGDFSRCFITGDSAGGAMVHNVAMQAVGHGCWESQLHQGKALMEDVSVQGLLIMHPFFTCGKSLRVVEGSPESYIFKYIKARPEEDPLLDPLSPAAPRLASATLPRVLVFVAGKDELKQGGMLYYEGLVKAGKAVQLSLADKEGHVFHLLTPDSPNVVLLLDEVKGFIHAETILKS